MAKTVHKINIKSKEEVAIVIEGGKRLSEIKRMLFNEVKVGVSSWDMEKLALELIKKSGGEASFKRVPGYRWATCINVNEGIVHGIPKKELIFKKGDIVSVDIGLFYKGFNTDTSFTKGLAVGKVEKNFLNTGELALKNAIKKAVSGNFIYDISEAIENTLKNGGYNPVRALVGHGVGRELHEDPQIPQFIFQRREKTARITPGMVLAIEVIYTSGNGSIVHDKDGWTIITGDGKISALYENTVVVAEKGNFVVTR